MTDDEQSLVANIYAQIPLPYYLSLANYDHVNVHDYFFHKGSSHSFSL